MFCTAKEGFPFLLSSNKMVWRCVLHCLQTRLLSGRSVAKPPLGFLQIIYMLENSTGGLQNNKTTKKNLIPYSACTLKHSFCGIQLNAYGDNTTD